MGIVSPSGNHEISKVSDRQHVDPFPQSTSFSERSLPQTLAEGAEGVFMYVFLRMCI